MKLTGKNIVLTGAGSGIGQQLALKLLREGAFVLGVDLNESGLSETKTLAGDMSDRFKSYLINITNKEQIDKFTNELKESDIAIDGLINNAGIIQPFKKVESLNWEEIERVMDVNFYGLLYLTKAILPELKKRKESLLVNVSSMGGFLPVPGQAVYGASKAAVKLLTEALYAELKDTGVKVSIVYPGAVHTNISQNSGLDVNTEGQGEIKMTSAVAAAQTIIQGIKKEKYRILIGSDAKMMDFLYRLTPRKATELIAKQMKGLLKN